MNLRNVDHDDPRVLPGARDDDPTDDSAFAALVAERDRLRAEVAGLKEERENLRTLLKALREPFGDVPELASDGALIYPADFPCAEAIYLRACDTALSENHSTNTPQQTETTGGT